MPASAQAGLYVEVRVRASMAHVWELTQRPELHQRWDLRFSEITYLPRASEAEVQRFLYVTRIGFGLHVAGTGESAAQRGSGAEETTSSLRFASGDWKSLIREGSGYWRYVPVADGLRFLTWYDYRVRYGALGRAVDRVIFRPLIGWATAWSFDAMRLWAEEAQSPEVSLTLAAVYGLARGTVAAVWMWHGLVPKLLARDADERVMLAQAGLGTGMLPVVGVAEVAFGVALLVFWRARLPLWASALAMPAALVGVVLRSPAYLWKAFNPVTLNLGVAVLSGIALLVSARALPTARRCLRVAPREDEA